MDLMTLGTCKQRRDITLGTKELRRYQSSYFKFGMAIAVARKFPTREF